MAEVETRLRTEFDEKILVHHELAMKRIVALEDLCAIYGLRLDEQKRTQNQQAMQLDDLQNQVGILFFRFHWGSFAGLQVTDAMIRHHCINSRNTWTKLRFCHFWIPYIIYILFHKMEARPDH